MKHYITHVLYAVLAIGLIAPVTAWSLVDPHCTDGECTEYVEDCWNLGNDVVCLNAHSEHAITLCLNFEARTRLLEKHPDVCTGTCNLPTFCNDGF
jgi:hypothetical protein